MERSRTFRLLRIAVTVLSLMACVLLIALWVRGYGTIDTFLGRLTATKAIGFESNEERLGVGLYKIPSSGTAPAPMRSNRIELPPRNRFGFGAMRTTDVLSVVVPPWCVVVLFAAIAAAPFIRWQFSLRTLLIATTLVAVGLGVFVAVN
jgi:hypothetical protein